MFPYNLEKTCNFLTHPIKVCFVIEENPLDIRRNMTEARACAHQGLKHSAPLPFGREGHLAPCFCITHKSRNSVSGWHAFKRCWWHGWGDLLHFWECSWLFIPWPLTKDWRKNSALPWIYHFPWRSDLSRIFGSIQASMRFTRSLRHRQTKK